MGEYGDEVLGVMLTPFVHIEKDGDGEGVNLSGRARC